MILLESADGHRGWGEIAPLPGFSRESLDDALAQSKQLAAALRGERLCTSLNAVYALTESLGFRLLPSVRCGLESAVLHLAAEVEQRAISFKDHSVSGDKVPLNGLLVGTEDDILRHATMFVNQGYRAVKLKVGKRSVDEEIELVYRVHARLGGKATLRLDANRAWTLEQAISFGKAIEVVDVEYVEEPLQDNAELTVLGKHWRLPIALDETLVEQKPQSFQLFDGLKALVLKPTLLGGFSGTMAWAQWAESNSVMPVVSSSFETDLGLTMLGHFAIQIAPDTPCGLDTSGWFKENLLQRPLPISVGHLQLDSERSISLDIRTDRLTEVFHA